MDSPVQPYIRQDTDKLQHSCRETGEGVKWELYSGVMAFLISQIHTMFKQAAHPDEINILFLE